MSNARTAPSLQRFGKRGLTRAILGLLALLVVACVGLVGVMLYPLSSNVGVKELLINPSRMPGLSELTWELLLSSESESRARQAWEGKRSSGAQSTQSFVLDVYKAPNKFAALWDYSSSIRINWQRNVPNGVFDVDHGMKLEADQFDAFCVDIHKTFAADANKCGLWVYWARYEQFRIHAELSGSDLVKATFLDIVRVIDKEMGAGLSNG